MTVEQRRRVKMRIAGHPSRQLPGIGDSSMIANGVATCRSLAPRRDSRSGALESPVGTQPIQGLD
jgi:hypothetical protein